MVSRTAVLEEKASADFQQPLEWGTDQGAQGREDTQGPPAFSRRISILERVVILGGGIDHGERKEEGERSENMS